MSKPAYSKPAANAGGDDPFAGPYAILSGEDTTERACDAIPDAACREVPRNYVLNVANGAATKLAEQIAGPGLVLPWMLQAAGAPVYLIGLLMPVKQVGSLLPQLAVSGLMRSAPVRKWFWVGAGLFQALMLWLMIVAAGALPPLAAGAVIVALLALYSIASGTGSVAFQDVVGKTIGKGRRGRMLANRATLGGVLAVAAGLVLRGGSQQPLELQSCLYLLAVGGGLWALAALLFAAIAEPGGATQGGRNPLGELRAGISLFREVAGFRRYLGARAALLSVEIAAPFYVVHARQLMPAEGGLLGVLIIAVAAAQVVSSPVWGRFADASARRVMMCAGALGALTALAALALEALPAGRIPLLYALVFVLLGFAEGGVRLGRKTYLVDAVSSDERATYVAFANSAMGLVTLLAGGLGALAWATNLQILLAVLILLGVAGIALSAWMPEAEHMLGADAASAAGT